MFNSRIKGFSHCYLDTQFEDFSNVAVGLLIRSLGSNLNICYINFEDSTNILKTYFDKFENLKFDYFKYSDFSFNLINNYDIIILDGCNFNLISKIDILKFINKKNENLEFITVFNNKENFENIYENFDLVSKFDYAGFNFKNNSLISITGNGKGKSTFSFGYLIRYLINNFGNVDLTYFDKGGNFYSERTFFNEINFKYQTTGLERFDGKKFRFENIKKDFDEANRGLTLISNSDADLIIAEELNTTIGTSLLKSEEILDILENRNSEILITGRYCPKEILDKCDLIIEVIEIKHYVGLGFGVKKGIDY